MTSFPCCEHRKHMDPWSRKHILVWWSANKKQIIVYNSILIKKTCQYKVNAKTCILRFSLVAATIFLIRFKNNRPHELRNSNEYNFVQTYNYLSFIEVIPGKLQSFQLPDQKQGVVYDNFSSGYTRIWKTPLWKQNLRDFLLSFIIRSVTLQYFALCFLSFNHFSLFHLHPSNFSKVTWYVYQGDGCCDPQNILKYRVKTS